jgi:hypothetical protein
MDYTLNLIKEIVKKHHPLKPRCHQGLIQHSSEVIVRKPKRNEVNNYLSEKKMNFFRQN